MRGIFSTLAIVWRIASPFFQRAEDRWPGRILLAAVIAIELSLVGLNVFFNQFAQQFPDILGIRIQDPMLGGRGVAPLATTFPAWSFTVTVQSAVLESRAVKRTGPPRAPAKAGP